MRVSPRTFLLGLLPIFVSCSSTEPPARVAALLQIVSGNSQSDTVGQELPAALVVKVTDSAGNPVNGQVVNFVVTKGGGHVFAGVAITGSNGQAQERWTLGHVAADSQQLEARAVDNVSGAEITFATFNAVAVADAPDSITVHAGQGQSTVVSNPVAVPPEVRVADRFGNPVSNTLVVFTVTGGGGSVTGDSAHSDSLGIAHVGSWRLGASAGTNTLSATVTGLTPASFTAESGPGTVRASAGDSQVVVLGNAATPGVRTTDAANVPVAGVPVTFSGSGTIVGGNQVTDANGVATVTSWTPASTGLSILVATATGFAPETLVASVIPVTLTSVTTSGSALTTCATGGGATYCWGNNVYGQLADGSTTGRRIPAPFTASPALSGVTPGGDESCGLSGTAAYCVGLNTHLAIKGLLGIGNTSPASSTTPLAVTGGIAFTTLSPSGTVVCGLAGTTAYCWGDDDEGAVGDNAMPHQGTFRSAPVAVALAPQFLAISVGGAHACGIATDSTAYCWGDNSGGQVGSQAGQIVISPVPVDSGHRFTAISAGGSATCGIATDGATYCWGNAMLGNGSTGTSYFPVTVTTGVTFTSVSVGGSHACALTAGGQAWCWGFNDYGQLGDSTLTRRTTPVQVHAPAGVAFTSITVGEFHTCALSSTGSVYCWGLNTAGQLGFTGPNQAVPHRLGS